MLTSKVSVPYSILQGSVCKFQPFLSLQALDAISLKTQSSNNFSFAFIYLLCLSVCVHACTCHRVCMEVGGQPA